ncbi:30S ribosomal protein S6 [Chloroflexota bacterium]
MPEEVKAGEETVDEVAVEEVEIDNAGTDEVIVDRVTAEAEEVPVEVDRQLRDYELVLIISPEVAEERFEAVIDNVSQFVTGKGGVIASIDRWGKRSLAYPIKHHVDGSYVLARFKMKPAFGKELETSLRISTEVLRHLLIKLDN